MDNKDLHIVCAHLDDFEISCYGYIFKHQERYENIFAALFVELWLWFCLRSKSFPNQEKQPNIFTRGERE